MHKRAHFLGCSAVAVLGVSAVSLLFSARAFAAGPPIPFDGYTVSNGTITAACPMVGGVQALCENSTVDNGMLQREITIPSGVNAGTYIQFILTDPGVTGDAAAIPFSAARGNLSFTNEDFVKMYNREDGISSKQTIIESTFVTPTTEDRFTNETNYEFGWASSTGNPWVDTFQEIAVVDYSVNPLSPTEDFNATSHIISNASGFNTTLDIEIDQMVDLTDDEGTGAQKFAYQKKGGFYQLTSRTADGSLLPGGSNGGDISWALGEMLAAVWVGQIIDSTVGPGSQFGHTAYRNEDQGTSTGLSSIFDPEAVNWVEPPFTPVGPMSAVSVIAPTATVSPPTPLLPTVAAGTTPPLAPTTPVALPVPYDSWTVAGGVITPAPCPVGATCGKAIAIGQGVFQRVVKLAGVTYFQTIVTDANATGDPTAADFAANSLAFKSETFVRADSVAGVASTLHLAERDLAYKNQPTSNDLPRSGGQFVYSTENKTGWANGGPLDPTFTVYQRVLVPDQNYNHVSSMDNIFYLEQGATELDKKTDMSTVVGTSAIADFNHPIYGFLEGNGFVDPIMFNYSMVSGAYQDTTRVLNPFDPLLPSNGGDIAWAAGDAIQATWVGGNYITSDPMGVSTIGTTSYVNLTTGDRASSFSLTDPNPETWVNPFTPPGLAYTNLYIPPP